MILGRIGSHDSPSSFWLFKKAVTEVRCPRALQPEQLVNHAPDCCSTTMSDSPIAITSASTSSHPPKGRSSPRSHRRPHRAAAHPVGIRVIDGLTNGPRLGELQQLDGQARPGRRRARGDGATGQDARRGVKRPPRSAVFDVYPSTRSLLRSCDASSDAFNARPALRPSTLGRRTVAFGFQVGTAS